MIVNLWGFLSVGVIFGVLFAMFVIYIDHKKTLKQLEIEALKNEKESFQVEVEKPYSKGSPAG